MSGKPGAKVDVDVLFGLYVFSDSVSSGSIDCVPFTEARGRGVGTEFGSESDREEKSSLGTGIGIPVVGWISAGGARSTGTRIDMSSVSIPQSNSSKRLP